MAAARAHACSTGTHAGEALVGQHLLQFRLVGLIGDDGLPEFTLARTALGGQNMAGERMVANDLACSGLFEPFGRAFMGLQLQLCHWNCPGGSPSRDTGGEVTLISITCA